MLAGILMAILFLRHTMSPSGFSARITRQWHRQVCRAFNIDINVIGSLPNEPMLIVANHISWLDITTTGSIISARYLSKYEVVGWPVIGWLARKAGTLFIKKGTRASTTQSLDQMTAALSSGDHVVLFPEGKTTDGEKVRKFHARLFQCAIDSNKKVQPVFINYPHETGVHPKAPFIDDITLYESAIGLLGEPHLKVDLHFLEPVSCENKTRSELAKECETLIQDALCLANNHQ